MPKGTTYVNDYMKLVFQATPGIANLLDNASASPLTSLFIALHTADPSAGDQTTSEANYTGYGRVAVARTSGGWTVSAGLAENAAAITFGACTAGSNTITHASIGQKISGADELYYSGALTASLAVSNGITPSFAINALTVTES